MSIKTAPRLPKGITKRPAGWRISVRVHGALYQRSFKPSTAQSTVEAELLKERQKRRRPTEEKPPREAGTLEADIARYLVDHFAGRPGLAERTRHLALWTDALGKDTARSAITRDDVARVLNRWRAQGLGADTCNKRRTALLALYHALDGKGGSNPVREIKKFRPPDPLPRGVAYGLIEKALAQFPPCRTRARLAVMAYTGLRQGQVMQLAPDDWDTRRKILVVRGTSKGRGTKPYVIPLSPAATAALVEFDTADAWGRFSWGPMARMWKEAWIAATTKRKRIDLRGQCAGLPAPVPYDLRHSFGTEIYRKTGDLKATKELLGHSSIKMTERYMLAAVSERRQRAIDTAFKGRKLPVKVATLRKQAKKRRAS